MKRMIVMAVSILLALTLAMPVAFGQPGQGSTATGASEKLAAAWWQWGLSKPAADNPLFGGGLNYTQQQCDGTPLPDTVDDTWFLAGTLGDSGGAVERTCTVPDDTTLFFPAFNVVIIREPDNPGDTEAHLFDQAHGYVDAALADPKFSMVVTVDGNAVPKGK